MATAFNEMHGPDGELRPAYQELSRWLKEMPPDALEYRRQEAELLFRRIGITFAVYGDAEAQERLIPFDVVPRIISAREWTILEKGLKQRVKALNLFLRDIYHAREILRACDHVPAKWPIGQSARGGLRRFAPYTKRSPRELRSVCVGLIGAAEALTRELSRERLERGAAVELLATMIVALVPARGRSR